MAGRSVTAGLRAVRRRGRRPAALDELGEGARRGEALAPDLVAGDRDAELLLHRYHQLQGVDRVEPEALAEQRLVVADRLRPQPFQTEARHHQTLDALASGGRIGRGPG